MNHNARKRPADSQEAAWVADEDRFVLQQAKKKAAIRVKEGRGKPIDWLAVTLRFSDSKRSVFDDEVKDSELDIVNPMGVFEGLSLEQLLELEKDIDVYACLETDPINVDFWQTMRVICADKRKAAGPRGRSQDTVSAEIDQIFGSKSLKELEGLETSIKAKLASDEPVDAEYWGNLLQSLISWKAKSKLQGVSRAIVESQLNGLRQQQAEEARILSSSLFALFPSSDRTTGTEGKTGASFDPEPMLKARAEDKGIMVQDETAFLQDVAISRRKILKLGFVPLKRARADGSAQQARASQLRGGLSTGDELSQVSRALYDREVARGVSENEEVFVGEELVSTANRSQWSHKHHPRKPRYFNRVQMGYEWNKYNQTHYDHDNPPPKVVQGYKFNVFYPDLIDITKAPTYRIEREGGRKRGQTFASPGEEDTCLIRFIAGPPYEDVAFRIVDKEWDYSAKRDRGYRSSFDKGILQLHFQFKKVFYRK